MIVYHTFRSTATIIYILQPNGDHHWNQKEILNQTGGGDISKFFMIFMHKAVKIYCKLIKNVLSFDIFLLDATGRHLLRTFVVYVPLSMIVIWKTIKPK